MLLLSDGPTVAAINRRWKSVCPSQQDDYEASPAPYSWLVCQSDLQSEESRNLRNRGPMFPAHPTGQLEEHSHDLQNVWFSRCAAIMNPLPQNVMSTSIACDGSLSPNHAAPAIHPKPTSIMRRTRARLCFRKPTSSAMVPNKATSNARLRCTLSSAGRKCAATAEKESSTGVSRQWTTHRADVHVPKRSAHSRELAVDAESIEDIPFTILRMNSHLQTNSSRRPVLLVPSSLP